MLTYEKVLGVFADYIASDDACEVIHTKHGYTVMQWDEQSKDWFGVEFCETPEKMWEELLSSFRMTEAQKLTKARRELTDEDNALLDKMCDNYIAQHNS